MAVVGNEDDAYKISADLHRRFNDVGFTILSAGVTYWNAAHLARPLKAVRHPPSWAASPRSREVRPGLHVGTFC